MYNDNMPFIGRDNYPPERPQNPIPEEPVMTGRARIRVIGVGGAGNNAVNRMIEAGIMSADYVAVNTDAQILACSKADKKIQIGAHLTKGLGAGADPEIGRNAAEESKDELVKAVENTDLLFITAGMGGGTGTGAAPVIAKIAKDLKILTVAVVTEPFSFEGKRRMENTMKGIDNLRKYVDTIIIIPNEKISDVAPKNATMEEALRVADDVLKQGIRGIADLIVTPALINLDFADVKTILKDKGLAHMGVGVAKGENRIVEAVRLAVNCPLLETTIEGATGVILNVVGGNDLTFEEVRLAASLIHSVVDYSANIIFGACIDENISDEVEVTVIATGFPSADKIMQESARGVSRVTTPAPRPLQPYGAPQQPNNYSAQPQQQPQQPQQIPRDRLSNIAGNSRQNVPQPSQQNNYPAQPQQQPVSPTYYGNPPQPDYGITRQGFHNAPQQGGYNNNGTQDYRAPQQGGFNTQQGYNVPPQNTAAPVPVYEQDTEPKYPPAVSRNDVAVADDDYSPNPRDQKLPPFVQRLLGKKK